MFWKCNTPWGNALKEDMAGASEAMVQKRNKFKAWVHEIKDLQEKSRKITGAMLSEEQKAALATKMKEYCNPERLPSFKRGPNCGKNEIKHKKWNSLQEIHIKCTILFQM